MLVEGCVDEISMGLRRGGQNRSCMCCAFGAGRYPWFSFLLFFYSKIPHSQAKQQEIDLFGVSC